MQVQSAKINMIYLGSDHGGFTVKEKVKTWLKKWGYQYQDLGPTKLKPQDDFPDFAYSVAEKVARKKGSLGILICRGGAGMDIVANKVKGIRSVLGFDPKQTYFSKKDDHTNILSLPADYLSEKKAKKIVRFFLETDWDENQRFLRRVQKIKQIET